MYGENTDADVVMTIIASGDFRVKELSTNRI